MDFFKSGFFKRIFCLLMVFILVFSLCIIRRKAVSKPAEATTAESSVSSTAESTATEAPKPKEKIYVRYGEYSGFEKVTYDEMLKNLDRNLSKFDASIGRYIKELVRLAYKNYGQLYEVFSLTGMPDGASLINEKIVKPISTLDHISLYREGDKGYDELYEQYRTCVFTEEYPNGNLERNIYLLINGMNAFQLSQIVLEELIHSGQTKIYGSNASSYMINLRTEGQANAYSCSLPTGLVDNQYLDCFYKDKDMDEYIVGYGLGFQKHSFLSKYNVQLLALFGFKGLEEMTFDEETIAAKLNAMYGADGEKYIECILSVIDAFDNNELYSPESISKEIEITNIFLDCLKQKAELIDNKEDAADFINMYKYLKAQYGDLYSVYQTETDEYYYKTDDLIRYKEIEDLLFEKNKEYGVYPQINSYENAREIFGALFYSCYDEIDCFMPISIKDAQIKYNPQTDTLKITKKDVASYQVNVKTSEIKSLSVNPKLDEMKTDLLKGR